jgi:proline iminopeptidase
MHTSIAALTLALTLASCASSEPATENYIQTDDHALLRYRKVGSGPENVVVLSSSWLSPDLDRLAEGRTLFYYDLRNRGASGRAGTVRMERDLEDLAAVLDWFKLERVTLVGHDYNAALAALYASREPQRVERLVLLSPIPPRKFPYWNIYERVYGERVDDQAFEKLRELDKQHARRLHPEEWAAAYRQVVLSGWVKDMDSLRNMKARPLVEPNLDPEPLHRQYKALIASLGEWDWSEDLKKVQARALVVAGDADSVPAESTAEWATLLSGAQAKTIRDSGRLPWVEQPSEFFPAVEGFLGGAQ